MAPLKDILPTLSATLLMLTSRILVDWAEISAYVENFVAGQDTFLYEDRHDRLLFDDDNLLAPVSTFGLLIVLENSSQL